MIEEDKITLDREAFKALASDTRVSIIKSLGKRRKMLTELSKQLGMSPSTVKEHMESLTSAGLVRMIDDGHKWKYYELTRKGDNILNPSGMKIWILLSVSILAIIVSIGDMLRSAVTVPSFASGTYQSMDMLRAPVAESAETLAGSAPKAADAAINTAAQTMQIPYFHIVAIVIFSAVAIMSAYRIYQGK